MTDVAMAAEQDAIAESLLGEPEESSTAEVTGTEQQEEVQPDTQTVETEGEQLQEVAEDWLPTEQDKVFSDEVYARYAGRYQLTPEQAADPLLRQLLHDKINTDIYLKSIAQQEEIQEAEREEVAQQEPTQPQLTREQYFSNLERAVQQRTDPETAKAFHGEFLRAFGVPEAEIAKVPPQQAAAFTNVMSKYALNLVQTFLPDLLQAQLPQQVSQAFPGFGDMYERSSYAMSWDQVRNSNPQYADLPSYGTKEFTALLKDAADKVPELIDLFSSQGGKIPPQQAAKAYAALARIAKGQQVDPALLQRAAQAGAQNARRAAVRRSAGNLGSGQSKGASGKTSSRFQTNDDLFDDDTMDLYQREHGRL